MADTRRRGLQRLAERGDPGARAALLVERVRLGELAPGRLGLLALLGDAAARAALGDEAPAASKDLPRWVRALARHDPQASDRAILALAEADLGARAEWPELAGWQAEAAAAARAWVERPSAERRQRLKEVVAGFRWHGQAEVMTACEAVGAALAALGAGDTTEDAVRAAKAVARHLGEEAARATLAAALAPWAVRGRGEVP